MMYFETGKVAPLWSEVDKHGVAAARKKGGEVLQSLPPDIRNWTKDQVDMFLTKVIDAYIQVVEVPF